MKEKKKHLKQRWSIPQAKPTSFRNDVKRCDGFVLPLVLIIMALIFAVSGFVLVMMRQQIKDDRDFLNYNITGLIRRSALETCQAALCADPDYTGTQGEVQTSNGGSYAIEVVKVSSSQFFVTIRTRYEKYDHVMTGKITMNEAGNQIKSVEMRPERAAKKNNSENQ